MKDDVKSTKSFNWSSINIYNTEHTNDTREKCYLRVWKFVKEDLYAFPLVS